MLPVAAASDWVVLPSCGAVVMFSGTSRDHSGTGTGTGDEGTARVGVTVLEYEVYDTQATPRLVSIVTEMRYRWSDVGRIALLHRVGEVPVGQSSVVVAVSAPHRESAFEAARFGIDTLKATVPIWKKETWNGGSAWGLDGQSIREVPAGARDSSARIEGAA